MLMLPDKQVLKNFVSLHVQHFQQCIEKEKTSNLNLKQNLGEHSELSFRLQHCKLPLCSVSEIG